MQQLSRQLGGRFVINTLDSQPRIAHLHQCGAQTPMVLNGRTGYAVNIAGGAFSAPQDRSTPADHDVLNGVLVERLEDLCLVEVAVLMYWSTHVARSPSLRSSPGERLEVGSCSQFSPIASAGHVIGRWAVSALEPPADFG